MSCLLNSLKLRKICENAQLPVASYFERMRLDKESMKIPEKYTVRSLGEYQRMMDTFEIAQDGMTLPDVRLLFRVDAHRFGPAWADEPEHEYPFGSRFIEALAKTAEVLMSCGLKTSFAFMHGDEVSLLLDEAESNNSRRRSRLISIASSAATAGFLDAFGKPALFFTRFAELPNLTRVFDYFLWQRKVAMRNFLSRTLGLLLMREGLTEEQVAAKLKPLTDEASRKQLLTELGRTPDTISDYELYGAAWWWSNQGAGKSDAPALMRSFSLPDTDSDYVALLGHCLANPGIACPESLAGIPILTAEASLHSPPPATRPAAQPATSAVVSSAPSRPTRGQVAPAGSQPREAFRLGPKQRR